MTEEAVQAARDAAEHLDEAHDLLARAKRSWEPDRAGCPCGPPALRRGLEATADAIGELQEVLLPIPSNNREEPR